jgi:hypothetical protein
MMMTWMVSFFSLTAESAEQLAATVLDDFGGDIADASPAAVMNAIMNEYYKRSEAGSISIEDTPRAVDMGFVTPARIESMGATLGDGTYVSAPYLGIVMSTATPHPDIAEDYHGVTPDGSLILKSGGTVPPLADEDRERVWVALFSDPYGVDQEKIDQVIADPPAIPENPSFVEQSAINAYQHVVENALAVAEQINSGESHNH